MLICATRETIGRFSPIIRLNGKFESGFCKQPLAATRLALGPRRGSVGKKGLILQKKISALWLCVFLQMMFRLNHDFLQFPEGPASSVEYILRRDQLTSRRVLEATVIDRGILRDVGLWGVIEPYLHRTWTEDEASFTCRGWDRIMATEEDVVYTELLLEFLSTIQFAPRAGDPRSRLVRFRLGGVHRECNLREFGRRVGLYTPEDLQHRFFTRFFGSCIQGEPDRAANMEIWAPLSNVIYEAGTSRERQLRDPLHRLMHRIVSTSIMQREGGEKVSSDDMTFLWVLLDPSRFLHLPFARATVLATRSTGASTSSPLSRGYFITRLVRSYGILTAPVAASLTALPPSRTTARTLERMRLIEQQRPGQFSRAPTEPRQAPQPAYAQPELMITRLDPPGHQVAIDICFGILTFRARTCLEEKNENKDQKRVKGRRLEENEKSSKNVRAPRMS
ncbi:hypothetical protein L1887_14876 [Cichorium endivia]|nr:hypothetical protein L1887_14876 [Cichorium endivia]